MYVCHHIVDHLVCATSYNFKTFAHFVCGHVCALLVYGLSAKDLVESEHQAQLQEQSRQDLQANDFAMELMTALGLPDSELIPGCLHLSFTKINPFMSKRCININYRW